MITASIVGLGRWGRTLVGAVQGNSDQIRFTHAVSRDPEPHRDFAAEHGLALVCDLAAVLADPAIDAVVLATPHSQHVEQVIAAAAAGKAVFCEKPLALTRAEAERAVGACEQAGVVLGIGTDKRFFPSIQEMFRLVDAGELGQLLHIEGHFSNEVSSAQFSEWRHSEAESPAGGMTGTGIHVLDAMIRVAGPVHRVQAHLLSYKPAPDPLDSLAALLEFDSGIGGTLATVRATPMFVRLHVFGRNGSAEALGRTELVLRKSGADPEHRRFGERAAVDSVRVNLDAFADAVAGRAAYPISPRHILAVTAAFEAIVQAVAA